MAKFEYTLPGRNGELLHYYDTGSAGHAVLNSKSTLQSHRPSPSTVLFMGMTKSWSADC